jgi:two-component system response regulator AtoC
LHSYGRVLTRIAATIFELMPEPITLPASTAAASEPALFAGSANQAMRTLESIASEIAGTTIPILIAGESGTGKQILARRILEDSPRRSSQILRIVCGTLNPETLPAQLRINDRKAPTAGTVIFDEIGDLDRESQRRLLHVLPDSDATPAKDMLGARVISTTSQNLEEEVRAGRFRSDLYYRVNGMCLRIPPLRERREDIPLLMDFFLAKHSARFGRPSPSLSAGAISRLTEHSWSGNVRELENVAMKIVALGDEEIALADLSGFRVSSTTSQAQTDQHSLKAAARAASREAEKELILKALARTRWNRKRAAQDLQISYKSLLYKLKQIGLPAVEAE